MRKFRSTTNLLNETLSVLLVTKPQTKILHLSLLDGMISFSSHLIEYMIGLPKESNQLHILIRPTEVLISRSYVVN